MSDDTHDEFYVGYLDRAPAHLGRFVHRRVLLILALAGLVAAGLAASMSPFSAAVFEFGTEREFEGILVEHPVPALLVARPGDRDETSRYLLTTFGKHGAAEAVRGMGIARVRLKGTLVHRDDRTMIELADDGIEVLGEAPTFVDTAEDLGVRTFVGEIVDSKCYLGVMKPGNLKPHRACAVRCIAGGVPPVLLVRDAEGSATYLVLVGPDGGAVNDAVLDRIAEPVSVTGRVVRRDDLLFLHADPAEIRRRE